MPTNAHHMIPIKKLPTAIEIARRDGLRQLGKKIASYYAPNRKPKIEPHLQMLQGREDLVVAEIGVWRGNNARRLCEILDIEKLYLIDPYDKYDEWDFPHAHEDISHAENEARDKLSEYDCVTWIKDYSDEAAKQIECNLDYVYVDGNHSYEFVKSDLELYYDLLAEDGIIAGDDIHFSGVALAVSEFAVGQDLQPHFEKLCSDWYFIKGMERRPSQDYIFTPENVYETLSERT
ncbi:MAG: class I SAM-dependent methyltransferase [Halobacteriaceae archaeon]